MPEVDLRKIDIVVPVYKGVEQTRRCLSSVIKTTSHLHDVDLIVVDDATPDSDIETFLHELQSQGETVLKNQTNLGFTKTANRGLLLHPDRDVILLNSDTEVANNWVSRLQQCAYHETTIGTVTPFSNNATICSYPVPNWSNSLPRGHTVASLDDLFRRVNQGQYLDIPTAVGFCMYLRHDCITAVGLFDEKSFSKGYGEENDFSMRAAKLGWRNVLCADTFVFHEGHVSFQTDRTELQTMGMRALLELHPDYDVLVRDFLDKDPPQKYRLAVDEARVAMDARELKTVIAEREEAIHDLRDADWLLNETRRELKAHEIALANSQREARTALLDYQHALERAERFVREREEDVSILNAELRQLRSDYETATLRLTGLQDENKLLEAKLHAIINSRTWRYTQFLRRSK